MIGIRGGQLWVWAGSVSGDTAMIHTATSAQRAHQKDRAFERVDADGVIVWLERDMAIDDVLIGWTLFTGFDVTWPQTMRSLTNGP
jgi:hypothetical protein